MEDDCLKPVTIDDISLIEHYLKLANYEESNHNVVNMMIWLDLFKLYQWHDDDMMIIICIFKDITFAYMPLCSKAHFIKAIDRIEAIFAKLEKPVVLNCFTQNEVDYLKACGKDLPFVEYTDINDYIYPTEKLRTFSGKKLQKKRNNLNYFFKTYEGRFTYESLNQTNIEECRDFLDDWRDNECDEFLINENVGIERIFDHWDKFNISGGLIKIDGCVRAFIIGSELSANMGQINVEKADEEIRGLYQAILKEYLNVNMLDKKYLNREDDMGKANLRQAKMAYNPTFMIKKFITKGS